MNPTTPVPPTAAPAGQSMVDFVRSQRQTAAYVFLGLSALFLIGTIFLAVRAFRVPAAVEKPAETKAEDEEKPPLELPKAEVANLKRPSYMVGWIGCLAGFLITVTIGVFLQIMPPKPTVEKQQREARVVLLSAGGLLGAALILFGGFFFYLWSDSLTGWLDKGETKEMMWVVVPLLMVAGGAGLVFASVQPARAEERNDLTIRRLVYGSNFAVTVLLLFVVLVVVNVVAKRFPAKLDTTETGFYTLSDTTKKFLSKLNEPATLYVIMPESGEREVNDVRQFAYTAQDAAEGKLNLKFVSPVTNKAELARLQEKYPRLSRDSLGVLITSGEDEKRNAFIGFQDLFDINPRTGAPQGFAGEGKIMKELRFLADNEQKPVIYFTQSNGELNISSTPGVESIGGSAMQLKSFLEKAYLDVRPLAFPIKNPSVPDDAAVVIVAEPQTPLSNEAVDALRRYMNHPVKKGKLIVLAGATPGPNEKGMTKTGLEGLLSEFNVRLGNKFIYSIPTERTPDFRSVLVAFSRSAANNPIGQALGRDLRFRMPTPREVVPIQGSPAFKADPLLMTMPGPITWLEDDPVTNIETIIRDFNNEQVQIRKQLTDGPRSIAVVVSESGGGNPHGGPTSGAARLLVVGNSMIFSDRVAQSGRTPFTFDMIGVAIDWLRDRPALATEAETKKYKEYQPPEPSAVDTTRLVYLPLGLAMLLVTGLGTGVWVMRRK